MAEIFLAKQHGSEGFEKLVVLKRILTAFYADEQFRNMLIDEAHISMGLAHNNIAQILDVGKSGGRFFLVLELVDGWDLGRLVVRGEKAGTPLPVGLGLYTLTESCRALSYAHSRADLQGQPLQIVHRDVSPHNILISEQGEVKIIDFGIAKAMTKRDRTGAGIVKGKIAFMSPEQALGQPLDARSDLYAVGILLYLLTTGRRPFEGATDMEILLKAQSGHFTPAEQMNPNVSPSLSFIIGRSMSFDRDQRYQSADEMLIDLEAVLRSEFGSAGQTALKLWMAALARRDGEVPISRFQSMRFARPGSESVEGRSIELGDHDDEVISLEEEQSLDDAAGDPTLRPMPAPRRSLRAPRVSGVESTSLADLSVPLPDDGPGTGRAVRPTGTHQRLSDMSLSLGDADEGPPSRHSHRSGNSGGRGLGMTFVVIGVLAGGGAAAWKLLGGGTEPEGEVAREPAVAIAADAGARVAVPAPAAPTRRPPAPKRDEPAQADPATPESPPTRPAAPARETARPERARGDDERERPAKVDPYARARQFRKADEVVLPGIKVDTPKTE